VGRIFHFSTTGSQLDYGATANYTITWGGANATLALNAVAVNPDGNHFVVGGVRTPAGVTHRLIYFDQNLTTTIIIADFDHGTTVSSLHWSPDGKYLALGGTSTTATTGTLTTRVYRFGNGTLTELPRCQYNHGIDVNAVRWHPSGKYLALGGNPDSSGTKVKVLYFDQESLTLVRGAQQTLGATTGIVNDVDWSPNGQFLAAGGTTVGASQLFLMEFVSSVSLAIKSQVAPGAEIKSLNYNPDGGFLGIGGLTSATFQVRGYDVSDKTLTEITTLEYAHGMPVNAVQWADDGVFMALASTLTGVIDLRVRQMTENQTSLAKRMKKALIGMYTPAKNMYEQAVNVIQPLVTANSSSVITYVKRTLSSYTETNTNGASGTDVLGFSWTPDSGYLAAGVVNSTEDICTYRKDGNVLNRLTNATIAAAGSTDVVAFSPDQQYLAAGSISAATTNVYAFNGYLLELAATTGSGSNNLVWFPDSSNILINGGIYAFTGTSLTVVDPTFRANADLDNSGKYIAYTTAPNTLNVAKILGATVTTVTTLPMSGLSTLDGLAWGNPSTIMVYKATGIVAACYFDGTSLTLIGTGVTASAINAIDVDALGLYGAVGLNSAAASDVIEYSLTPITGPIISSGTISHGAIVREVQYSPDLNYLAVGGSAPQVDLYLRNFVPAPLLLSSGNTYTVMMGTSQAMAGLLVVTSYAVSAWTQLVIDNSRAINSLSTLVRNNSNSMNNFGPLAVSNSNAVAGLLVDTSNAVNNFVIPNSQTLVSATALIINNSNAANNIASIINTTSNAMVTYQPLIVANSNAVNGLLVATSNAAAGLLVATSNAMAGLLVATSNALAGLEVANSNALVTAGQYMPWIDTIDHGLAHVHVTTASPTFTFNLYLSSDHQLQVHTSSDMNFSSNSINFAEGSGISLVLDPGVTVTLRSVVVRNYSDARVSLGANAALWFGTQCRIELSEEQSLSRTWSFAGTNSRIRGNNTVLNVGTGQNYIAIQPQSFTTISNVILQGVRDNNIQCLDDTSSIVFDNTKILLSSDFSFTTGSLNFSGDVTLRGTSIFNYTTHMGSTLNSATKLSIDQGMTFNYAPANNLRNLLVMTDSTSVLSCNNATLVSTATGIQLTKGTLFVDGVMKIQSAAASSAEAVIFGDGTPANDLLVRLMPGAGIQVTSGYLNYKNAN
jgi:WD40 repeat protein